MSSQSGPIILQCAHKHGNSLVRREKGAVGGGLAAAGRGTLQPRGCDTNSLSASPQQRAIQDEAISESLPCLASFALLAMVRDGLPDCLRPLPPCQPATLRGGSTRTRRSQSTWPQRNSWQHPRACGNWSTFTLSQATASNAIRAHRLM